MNRWIVTRALLLAALLVGAAPGAARVAAERTVDEIVTDAIVALDAEIMLLVELDGFDAEVPAELDDIHETWASYMEGVERPGLVQWLADVDDDGHAALESLQDAGVSIASETGGALGLLSADDLNALLAGGTASVAPETYVIARDQILELPLQSLTDRRPSNNADPSTPDTVSADTTSADTNSADTNSADTNTPDTASTDANSAATPTTVAPTTVAATTADPSTVAPTTVAATTTAVDEQPGGSALPLVGAIMAAVVAMAGVLLLRRRNTSPESATAQAGRAPGASDPSLGTSASRPAAEADAEFDVLLEASRRMTNALDTGEIAGIALSIAAQLADAQHGAFVVVGSDDDELAAIGSLGDVVDDRRLGGGLLSRVAATGQSIRRVAHDEPAITALPAAVLAVPVIESGRVAAVLFLVRPETSPFTELQERSLSRLAPMVGSALGAASKHGAAAALGRTDALTGLTNRRGLDEDLEAALAAADSGTRTGVVMIDVDHFKAFNDREGHAAGDEALRAVGQALRSSIREQDGAYRYGGEEFALLLRNVDRDIASEVAERVRAAVARSDVPGGDRQPGGALTVSVGVALVVGDGPEGPDESVRLADAALYEAKESGRNRVCLAGAL